MFTLEMMLFVADSMVDHSSRADHSIFRKFPWLVLSFQAGHFCNQLAGTTVPLVKYLDGIFFQGKKKKLKVTHNEV